MRSTFAALAAATAAVAQLRLVAYYDEWHPTLPPKEETAGITHVNTAYAPSDTFLNGTNYTPFMNISQIRSVVDQGTKVCMSIGGGGDKTGGFSAGVANGDARKNYVKNIVATVNNLGFDCVDINWKTVTKDEIKEFVPLLTDLKAALGDKPLSTVLPGMEFQMTTFKEQCKEIDKAVDWVNVVSYSMLDNLTATEHHSSVEGTKQSIQRYIECGISPAKVNMGMAFFATFRTTQGECKTPTGCPIVDPEGKNETLSGTITFEEQNFNGSTGLPEAFKNGKTDDEKGAQWSWDSSTKKFYSWDTPDIISKKIGLLKELKLGGIFVWSLGEDTKDWTHLRSIREGIKNSGISGPLRAAAAGPRSESHAAPRLLERCGSGLLYVSLIVLLII